MGKTKIEWADESWNPVTGCTKVSAGCKNCYAERMARRFWAKQYSRTVGGQPRPFIDVRCHREQRDQPLRWRKPRMVFVCSMSDLFHEAVPENFILEVFYTMLDADHHTFQVLTKRPKRMLEFVKGRWWEEAIELYLKYWKVVEPGFPKPMKNVWFGVSVEDQKTAEERFEYLRQIPNACPWFSYEPALGPLVLTPEMLRVLKWVIAGGESGPNARPSHPDWFRAVRDQCYAAGVPFFFKRWGEYLPLAEGAALSSPIPSYVSDVAFDDGVWMRKVGKKRAGRLLDGKEHNEFPQMGQIAEAESAES